MNDKDIKVLLIEDNRGDARLIAEALTEVREVQFNLDYAYNLSTGLEHLAKGDRDVVLLDLVLPDSEGFDTFLKAHTQAPKVPIIVLTGLNDQALAIRMIREGAQDYLIKGYMDSGMLLRSIRYSIERKRVEEALRQSEERYRSLVETARDLIFTLSPDETISSLNPIFETITGWSSTEWLGKRFSSMVHPDDLSFGIELFQNTLQGHTPPIFELRVLSKSGEYLITEFSATPQIQDGEVVGILGIARDITKQKKMEEELLKAQKLESLGVLAGGIAHDFNNILTVIMGNVSLAKMGSNPQDKMFRRLKEVEEASCRAKDLSQQLVTFSKGGTPVKKVTSIGQLIKDSASFLLRDSNVNCEFSISKDLWRVEVDEGQIGRVINNLVKNAEQAMPEGGMIRVRVENKRVETGNKLPLKEGRYVEVIIEDEGVGISEKDLPKIFDPYFTTTKKGSGLGLTVAYSIIKNHNGYIDLESQVGVGTRFFIYLPASHEEIQLRGESKKAYVVDKRRILVMDDEEMIRQLAVEVLTDVGYEVEFARDGGEAIELYEKAKESNRPFDVVIMDLTIPGGLGGMEALKRLLESEPYVKAIASSGYSNDPVMSEFKKFGFKGVIPKPYNIEDLKETLYKVISEE